MRSIERRFRKYNNKKCLSTWVIFVQSVAGQNFTKERITRMFKKLVDKDEYAQNEKVGLIRYAHRISNTPKRTENERFFA